MTTFRHEDDGGGLYLKGVGVHGPGQLHCGTAYGKQTERSALEHRQKP